MSYVAIAAATLPGVVSSVSAGGGVVAVGTLRDGAHILTTDGDGTVAVGGSHGPPLSPHASGPTTSAAVLRGGSHAAFGTADGAIVDAALAEGRIEVMRTWSLGTDPVHAMVAVPPKREEVLVACGRTLVAVDGRTREVRPLLRGSVTVTAMAATEQHGLFIARRNTLAMYDLRRPPAAHRGDDDGGLVEAVSLGVDDLITSINVARRGVFVGSAGGRLWSLRSPHDSESNFRQSCVAVGSDSHIRHPVVGILSYKESTIVAVDSRPSVTCLELDGLKQATATLASVVDECSTPPIVSVASFGEDTRQFAIGVGVAPRSRIVVAMI